MKKKQQQRTQVCHHLGVRGHSEMSFIITSTDGFVFFSPAILSYQCFQSQSFAITPCINPKLMKYL